MFVNTFIAPLNGKRCVGNTAVLSNFAHNTTTIIKIDQASDLSLALSCSGPNNYGNVLHVYRGKSSWTVFGKGKPFRTRFHK